jgi:tetratricopeptide (TPR) repeat protein
MILRGLLPALVALALLLPFPAAQAQVQSAAGPDLYVVVLATVPTMAQRPATPLPVAFRGRSLYWRVLMSADAVSYQLCLGFFEMRQDAEQASLRLAPSFSGARAIQVNSRERDNLEKATRSTELPAPTRSPQEIPPPPTSPAPPTPLAQATLAPPASTPTAQASLGAAESLMAQGRAAIVREDYVSAIRFFTQLLALAENPLTRDAQEFLALSHERRGDLARARLEYENYLKRYPESDDSVRVRQRLANLRAAPQLEVLRAPAETRQGWRSFTVGSLSQFYYRGNSTIDTQQLVANTLDRTTLSLTDQSALISNLDLTARFMDETNDNRLVFRDTNTRNFVEGQNGANRLNAAYYEYKYKPGDFSARLGRQPGNSGGLLGRFDGALLGYGLVPKARLNLAAGSPVDQGFTIDSTRRFYGINAEVGPFDQRWSGSVYYIRQTVDSVPDREATGIEARYFVPQGFFASTVDYDTLFRHLNIGTMQGNWIAPWKTSYNFLVDYRMTPTLQTSTATIGEASTSVQTLLNTYSEDELRQRARALTARSALASAGLMHPVTREWQVGADFRVSRISHTDGTNNVPAIPGTGYIYTTTSQAIATGLFATRDVTVASLSRVSAPSYTGRAGRLNNRMPLGAYWTLEGSVLWYDQNNDDGSTLKRVSPTARLSYRWGNSMSLEAEYGAERTNARSAIAEENTRRSFFSLGYRWDF